MSKPSITLWGALVVALLFSGSARAQETKPKVPKSKQTPLELYVTASEAYARIAAKPDATLLIDVRTPEEYLFVGHAPMAHNIPLYFQSYQWDEIRGRQVMKPNPDFLRDLSAKVQKDTTKEVFVMCRSGGRSALAIKAMANAGFEKVWNITDGFEGAMVKDRKHPNFGATLGQWMEEFQGTLDLRFERGPGLSPVHKGIKPQRQKGSLQSAGSRGGHGPSLPVPL